MEDPPNMSAPKKHLQGKDCDEVKKLGHQVFVRELYVEQWHPPCAVNCCHLPLYLLFRY